MAVTRRKAPGHRNGRILQAGTKPGKARPGGRQGARFARGRVDGTCGTSPPRRHASRLAACDIQRTRGSPAPGIQDRDRPAIARLALASAAIAWCPRRLGGNVPTEAPGNLSSMFHSLRHYTYRMWAAGALVSNVGTWMQRIGQDWLVLVVLTDNSATAVGTVMALQFGPPLLLLPLTGFAADHLDRRKLLLFTQAAAGLLALGLGLLTLSGAVQLWHVYGFAFALGCVTAFDAPARQAFVSDLVSDDDLANAVALNSASFNAARMLGPAAAGVLIAAVGEGWLFVVN